MTAQNFVQDMMVLVADKDMEQSIVGVCSRSEALGVRPFSFRILVHPGRDPGCLSEGVEFLRPFQRQFAHALLVFDRMGSGRESQSRAELEGALEEQLGISGWGERAGVVVIDPELEAWVWSDSPHVDRILQWQERRLSLREWLVEQSFLLPDGAKPERPKEAMEATLRAVRLPRSSALYRQLAQQVSLSRCTDASFLKLKAILQKWFSG